ncbi:MAG: zf-TFIIB domain-containing protein, partial [Acidobacteriota bacterium]
ITEPTAGDLEYSTVDMDTFDHHDKYGPISCPRDTNVQMKKVDFNILTDIILDWCPECGGFWIDGKDLPRINEVVKRLNEADSEVSEPFYIRLAEFFWNLPFPR